MGIRGARAGKAFVLRSHIVVISISIVLFLIILGGSRMNPGLAYWTGTHILNLECTLKNYFFKRVIYPPAYFSTVIVCAFYQNSPHSLQH